MKYLKLLIIFVLFGACSINNNIDKNEIDSLKKENIVQKNIIDSLKIDIATYKNENDSLSLLLEKTNRLINQNAGFSIPNKIMFAGQEIDLTNPRIYTKFKKIFHSEVRNAKRFIPRSGRYFPIIDSILTKNNIPLDVKYLAIAESELNPMATSHAGAAGIWQFMKRTGAGYGLKINNFIDERRNIYKSTEAACDYLKNNMYYLKKKDSQDWLLVFCSYNAGIGNIYKIMKSQGGKTFFDLIMGIDETNRYLWRAIAIKTIFEYEEDIFNQKFFRQKPLKDIVRKANVELNGYYKLDSWAKAQGTNISKIWELNPWIKIYKTKRKKYTPLTDLALPKGKYEIHLPIDSEPNNNLAQINKKLLKKSSDLFHFYKVKKGDNLYGIAKRFNTTIYKIKKLNNLKSNVIWPNQKLKVYGTAKNVYVVKKGDSVNKIAYKLGVSTSRIFEKNDIKVKNKNKVKIGIIHPGDKIYY